MSPTASLAPRPQRRLVVFQTHPVQYHAPLYRELARRGVPLHVVYGSDFSCVGYHDAGFGRDVRWSGDLLAGYASSFLSTVAGGGARSVEALDGARVPAAMREAGDAVVLALGHGHPFDRAVIRAALRGARPLVLRPEAADAVRRRGPLRAALRSILLRALYRRVAAACAIGATARRHFLAHGLAPQKIFASPYAVDAASFDADEEARTRLRSAFRGSHGIAEEAVVVGFSGKLIPEKGIAVLAEAIGLLPASTRARVTLLVAGDGPLRGALAERLRAAGVTAVFAGFLNQDALSPAYHAMDLLVLPSIDGETWGLVVNEALLHGTPVLVSDRVGCASDLARDPAVGAVCRAAEPAALAQALAAMLATLPADAGRRAACRRAVAGYALSDAADGIVRAFERALESPR
jgi:glycosyltransferase involved in cell wall biosynthesis